MSSTATSINFGSLPSYSDLLWVYNPDEAEAIRFRLATQGLLPGQAMTRAHNEASKKEFLRDPHFYYEKLNRHAKESIIGGFLQQAKSRSTQKHENVVLRVRPMNRNEVQFDSASFNRNGIPVPPSWHASVLEGLSTRSVMGGGSDLSGMMARTTGATGTTTGSRGWRGHSPVASSANYQWGGSPGNPQYIPSDMDPTLGQLLCLNVENLLLPQNESPAAPDVCRDDCSPHKLTNSLLTKLKNLECELKCVRLQKDIEVQSNHERSEALYSLQETNFNLEEQVESLRLQSVLKEAAMQNATDNLVDFLKRLDLWTKYRAEQDGTVRGPAIDRDPGLWDVPCGEGVANKDHEDLKISGCSGYEDVFGLFQHKDTVTLAGHAKEDATDVE